MYLPWEDNNNNSLADILKLLQNQQGGNAFQVAQPTAQSTPINNIAGLLKSYAGANYNLSGMNLSPQQGQVAQLNNYADAEVNPDNPLYQKIYGQEQGAGQQDLAASIAELSRQNRKLSQLGRTPLFDPERGGETVFRGLTSGYQNVQDQARQRARQIIGAGQSATQNAFNAQNTLTAATQSNKKDKAFGIGNIADALPFLGKFLGL